MCLVPLSLGIDRRFRSLAGLAPAEVEESLIRSVARLLKSLACRFRLRPRSIADLSVSPGIDDMCQTYFRHGLSKLLKEACVFAPLNLLQYHCQTY